MGEGAPNGVSSSAMAVTSRIVAEKWQSSVWILTTPVSEERVERRARPSYPSKMNLSQLIFSGRIRKKHSTTRGMSGFK